MCGLSVQCVALVSNVWVTVEEVQLIPSCPGYYYGS